MEEDLGQLGWRGGLKYDSPEVVELRERCAPFVRSCRCSAPDVLAPTLPSSLRSLTAPSSLICAVSRRRAA